MIIDKVEFKRLKKEGGRLRCIIIVDSNFGSGNLCVNNDGIFFEQAFKDKHFISFESIKSFDVNGLNIHIVYEEDYKISFVCKKQKHVIELYNEYAKYNHFDTLTSEDIKNEKKEYKEAKKQRKKELFEKIMASNPEVSQSPQRIPSYIPVKEKSVCCPKCGSTQLTTNKKGYSLGKAIAGGVITLTPIVGVATGLIGKNKIIITCLNCGKQFKPGKR